MPKRNLFVAGAIALVSTSIAAPIAADIFAYRTEDGVFAYTDDRDKVPARYAGDVVTVHNTALAAYPRLTIEDSATTRAVTSRLEKRLDYLRQLNAASALERQVAAKTVAASGTVISIPTGAPGIAPTLEIAAGANDEPIVVEPILTKEFNRVRTRRATIVKQGDKVLAITKGPSHHIDVNSDIHDEDELLK
jgi:hypothetical protein